MSFDLPTDIAELIQAQLATGDYANPEDVLRDAMYSLVMKRDDFAAIQAGIEDLESGRHTPLDEVDAQMRLKYGIAPGS